MGCRSQSTINARTGLARRAKPMEQSASTNHVGKSAGSADFTTWLSGGLWVGHRSQVFVCKNLTYVAAFS